MMSSRHPSFAFPDIDRDEDWLSVFAIAQCIVHCNVHICIICNMYYLLYINLPHFSFCPVWTPYNLICISTQPFLSFLISFYFISSDRSIPSVLFQIISISPQFKVNYDTFHYIQGYILNWALGFPDRSKFPIFLRSVCPIKSIGQTYKRC